jgi:Domain of unknown function (DUF4384)
LTQQLWQATSATTLRFILGRTATTIGQQVDHKQQPSLDGQKSRDRLLNPYHLALPTVGADGVIVGVEETGKAGQIWLAGLPSQVLEQYSVNSLLSLGSDASTQLQVYGRDGLIAKARLVSDQPDASLKVGQLVQEATRVIPRNLGLSIALDKTLERIERVDAISAFSAIPYVSALPAGEQSADYLFGKVQATTEVAALPSASIAGLVTPAGYSLFSPGREVIPNTSGDAGEAIKVAVKRLAPQLQTLLAIKLLTLTANERSSRLSLQATLETIVPQSRILMQQTTDRASDELDQKTVAAIEGKMLTVPVGSRIQYRIQNNGQQPIYFVLLGLDTGGNAFVFYADSPQLGKIAPGETLTVPPTSPTFEWVVRSPIGITETQLICSRAPLNQTQTLLAETLKSAESGTVRSLPNPLEMAQGILQDLHQASNSGAMVSSDSVVLDVNAWATFRFVYQVV